MAFTDLYLIETGDGGYLVMISNDLKSVNGLENFIFLALFGGNPGQVTQGPKVNEQIFDYWGNYLFQPSDRATWYNSTFEYLLRNVAINSATRIQLEQAIIYDLDFISTFAKVTPTVQIVGVDKLKITILVVEIVGNTSKEYVFIWDATQQEIDNLPNGNDTAQGVALDFPINFEL